MAVIQGNLRTASGAQVSLDHGAGRPAGCHLAPRLASLDAHSIKLPIVDLDPAIVELIALGALGLGLLGLVIGGAARLRVGRLRAELAALRADPALAAGVDPKAVRNVSVVRYDAFADMGGRMSYSVALLDSAGDGIVLSAINGRADARAYAKGIVAGAGEALLSPEEQQAVDAALGRSATRSRR